MTYFIMNRILYIIILVFCFSNIEGQAILDTIKGDGFVIVQDKRINLLGEQMATYNKSLSFKTQLVDGFRLMLIKTSDRDEAMKLRSNLIKWYPDHKLYMIFVAPNIKLKMGNFIDREEAEKMRKQLLDQHLVPGNIYIVPEKVELKPNLKTTEPES
jgi:hypothetical protein